MKYRHERAGEHERPLRTGPQQANEAETTLGKRHGQRVKKPSSNGCEIGKALSREGGTGGNDGIRESLDETADVLLSLRGCGS